VLWLCGFATHLFLELSKPFGYCVPVFHQFCFLFGNSAVDLVHSVIHPWIAAVWRPCLALGYCFCESGFGGGWFFDRIDRINKMAGSPEVRSWCEAVLLLCGLALHLLCVLYG
jgi:hypothetical protein